jgi:hypothetical protein
MMTGHGRSTFERQGEAAMAKPKHPPRDDDSSEEDADEYGALREALHIHIGEFSEEHELSYGAVAMMLVDIAVSTRMIEYITSADKPSGSGLGVELDIFRRDFDEVIGRAKKRADEFVATAKRLAEHDAVEKL